MPIDAAPGVVPEYRLAITNARILRLAFGTALSLWFSQAVGWSVSYIAPIITLLLLATPMPRPKPKFLLVVVLALAVSIFGSFVFLPFVLHQMLVGFLLVALALFHSFYFSARGGAAVVGTLVTVGIAITVAIAAGRTPPPEARSYHQAGAPPTAPSTAIFASLLPRSPVTINP